MTRMAPGNVTEERYGVLATWVGDRDHGLSHLITGTIGSYDRAVCGVDMAPTPISEGDDRPRCSVCTEKFDGKLVGYF